MLFNLKKYSASDLAWIVGALIVSFVLAVLFYGVQLFDRNLDLHFHDTYFVIPNWLVLFGLFLFVLFIAFYYKSGRSELRTSSSFVVVFGCGIVITLLLTSLIAFSSFFLSGGWTIYPPLSALNQGEFIQTNPDFPFVPFSSLVVIFQFLIVLMVLRSAVRFGEFRSARHLKN